MTKKQMGISSWVFPIILLFVFPEVGRYFIIAKIVFSVIKGVNKNSGFSKNSSTNERASQYNDTEPHDIDFSHDHTYNDNTTSRSQSSYGKTSSFETEINVRCTVCNANNFIKEIPYECEYCGSKIVKI